MQHDQIQEARGIAAVASQGKVIPVDLWVDEDVDPCDTGFMDFFDWLAETNDAELLRLAATLSEEECMVVLGAMSIGCREAAGLAVWRNL